MTRKQAAFLSLVVASLSSAGCFAPSAGLYRAASAQEAELFARASRDVTPDSIRVAKRAIEPRLLVWAGILNSVTPGSDASSGALFKVEHHYWDWIVDYGTQTTRLLVSPRGEGSFQFSVAGSEAEWLQEHSQIGDFILVYGVPKGVLPEGAIEFLHVHARGFPKSRYALDVWDYGANFAIRGQGSPKQVHLRPF